MIINIETREDFLTKIAAYSDKKILFRGQTKNYSTEKYPYAFKTSFERNRCNPLYRFRWNYHSHNILTSLLKRGILSGLVESKKTKYAEALLQHYGWRSLFIDLSSDPFVSLFFAGHQFEKKHAIHMSEDYNENFLLEMKCDADYHIVENSYGYLYIIDKSIIENLVTHGIVDLQQGLIHSGVRPVRQSGFLIENVNGTLNEILNQSIIEVLKIKSSVISELCDEKGMTTQYLFPSNDEDIIYNILLSLPRKEFVDEKGKVTGIYSKPFEIPEYNIKFYKFQPPYIAYYSSFWVKDIINNFEGENIDEFKKRIHDSVDFRFKNDIAFHIILSESYTKDFEYKNLLEVLQKFNRVFIEFDNLFKYHIDESCEYEKGFFLELCDNKVMVEEIGVDYRGKSLIGLIGFMPRYYKICNNYRLEPIRVIGDCPCSDDDRHDHLIHVAKILFDDIKLKNISYKRLNEKTFECADWNYNDV